MSRPETFGMVLV